MAYKLEDVLKEIQNIRDAVNQLRNKDNEDYAEFVDIILDWLQSLFKTSMWERLRLKPDNWEDIHGYSFSNTLFRLQLKQTEDLEEVLFNETEILLSKIVEIGDIEMIDFNLLQFNLARLFGKNIDMVIEHVRVQLENKVEKIHRQEERSLAEKRKREEKESKRILEMPEHELQELVVSNMFDFSPSARTKKERIKAVRNNNKKVANQKVKFREFSMRLHKATLDAQAASRTNVRKKSENVRTEMTEVSHEFQKKAREFVSSEGVRKKFRESRKNIREKRSELIKDVESEREKIAAHNVGLKEEFAGKVEKARRNMLTKEQAQKMVEDFLQDTKKARQTMRAKAEDLGLIRDAKKREILERGKKEILSASNIMLKGQEHFVSDIEVAKKLFAGKGEELVEARGEMTEAREEFIEKRIGAQSKFTGRGDEIENLMYITLYKGQKHFIGLKEKAREKFLKTGEEVREKGSIQMGGMQKGMLKFRGKKEEFLEKGKKLKGAGEKMRGASIPGKSLLRGSEKTRSKIQSKTKSFLKQGKSRRDKMKTEIEHSRQLFELDVRFARHRLGEASKKFKELTEEKNEEFKFQQSKLTARHKAKQKANIIRNLLRTIRTMK